MLTPDRRQQDVRERKVHDAVPTPVVVGPSGIASSPMNVPLDAGVVLYSTAVILIGKPKGIVNAALASLLLFEDPMSNLWRRLSSSKATDLMMFRVPLGKTV